MKKLRPLRLLVTGGRDHADPGAVHALVVKTMNIISACGKRPVTVIHGGARGVDAMAGQWAAATHTPYEVYPITKEDWDRLGDIAGNVRNTEMLEKGKPDMVVAFPGKGGTADMVKKARAAGVRVYEVKL